MEEDILQFVRFADTEEEYLESDGDTFESVINAAAEKLGVEIY